MPAAIEFNDVSKRFVLNRDRATSFQQWFISRLQPARNGKYTQPQGRHEFWALRNVHFAVQHGESVALVGANGAGKSTALKLISRIISPTTGSVRVDGRVTALLELGAGFHPDLSGRDNVFLYGAIMGMPRRELQRRFDSIVDFAGIDEFVDEPVRNYSSGMQARLGFAVSVHLDPSILLVDEALAVGDQAFQQKCNERLQRMRQQNVTLFFVSHSLEAVTQNCARAIWLEHGKLMGDGPSGDIVDAYMQRLYTEQDEDNAEHAAPGSQLEGAEARLTRVEILGADGQTRHLLHTHEPCTVRMHYRATRPVENVIFGLGFVRADSQLHLAGPNSGNDGVKIAELRGTGYVEYHLDDVRWLPGEILVHASIYDSAESRCYHYWQNCARLTMLPGGTREKLGVMSLRGQWQVHQAAGDPPSPVQK